MYPRPLALLTLLTALLLGAPAAAQSSPTHDEPDSPSRPAPDANADPEDADALDDEDAPAEEPAPLVGADRLAFLLSGYEHVPDRAELDQLAEPAQVVTWLNELLASPERRVMLRLRALDLLSLYELDQARAPLAAIAAHDHRADDHPLDASERTRSQARHRALTALARNNHPRSFEIWSDALHSDDLQIRLTAIDLLRNHEPQRALPLLERLAANDTRPAVQRALNRPIGGAVKPPTRTIP